MELLERGGANLLLLLKVSTTGCLAGFYRILYTDRHVVSLFSSNQILNHSHMSLFINIVIDFLMVH